MHYFLAFSDRMRYHNKQRCQCCNRPWQYGYIDQMLCQAAEYFSYISMEEIFYDGQLLKALEAAHRQGYEEKRPVCKGRYQPGLSY